MLLYWLNNILIMKIYLFKTLYSLMIYICHLMDLLQIQKYDT